MPDRALAPGAVADGAEGGPSEAVRDRLDALLAVDGILGVALFDPAGRVQAAVNLRAVDATVLFNALSTAIGGPVRAAGQEPAFAAFTLNAGQIAIGSDERAALVALTDPGLDARALRGLIGDFLTQIAPPAPG